MQLFSTAHIVIIGLVPLLAVVLTAIVKRQRATIRTVSIVLAIAIGSNELIWYGYILHKGWTIFPYGLPLDLCDLVLWLTVYALLTWRRWTLDLIYFWGLVGSTMAVLTPDVGATFPSYAALKFFASHGGVVSSILFLVFTGTIRPSRDAWWRALLWLNVYAIIVGVFDFLFTTNYFYLCAKPAGGSLLDVMGPWPWYIMFGEAVASVLFFLLSLPLRGRNSS